MSSATLAGRIGTGQGNNNGGGGYCPPIVIENNTFATATLSTSAPFSGLIEGFNLDQVTNITATLVGNSAVVAPVTNIQANFLTLTFDVAVPQPGQYNVTLQGLCGNFSFQVTGASVTCLIPGQNGVNWQGVVNANVGVGTLAAVPGAGNGWNRGAHFGVAPAGTEASLKFTVAQPASAPNGQFGFIGLRNNPPGNIAFGSAGRAIYLQNGLALVYNNTSFQANIGAYNTGTEFELRRDAAGNMQVFKNAVLQFTFPTPDAGDWWFAASIFRNTSIEGIELCHS